jgi:hypothetical protein
MQTAQTTASDLFYACKKIFGHDINVSYDFLKHLQSDGVKTAFRKKAFETHPDRAMSLNSPAEDLNAEFINIRLAYETLLFFLETKSNAFFENNSFYYQETPDSFNERTVHHKSKNKNITDHFYSGNLPPGNLMFGQFLYYSGLISWRTLIEAICWQRRQRPLIGQIAVSWGFFSYPDVLKILNLRTFDEKFCECALRGGYISSFQQLALVGKQRKLQRPFGEFFVESGILSQPEVIEMAQKQQFHNMSACR